MNCQRTVAKTCSSKFIQSKACRRNCTKGRKRTTLSNWPPITSLIMVKVSRARSPNTFQNFSGVRIARRICQYVSRPIWTRRGARNNRACINPPRILILKRRIWVMLVMIFRHHHRSLLRAWRLQEFLDTMWVQSIWAVSRILPSKSSNYQARSQVTIKADARVMTMQG